jgi:hypothetical protein
MYPSEETKNRNAWQDEYDAVTREHAWTMYNATADEAWHLLDDDDDMLDPNFDGAEW